MVQIIVIAQGIEIRDVGQGRALQTFLAANCDRSGTAPAAGANNTWLFPKAASTKATHEIRVVYGMADLAAGLELVGAIVVYEGHSRYGQGPAFGPSGITGPDGDTYAPDRTLFPVNPWGVHFRMGYEATDTECIGDLLRHSVLPVEYDLTLVTAGAFLPEALHLAAKKAIARDRGIKNTKTKPKDVCRLSDAWRYIDVCEPARAAAKTRRGDQPLAGRHYYDQNGRAGSQEFLTSVAVGSADLDKTKLACRLLFMASCSSKVHFRSALVRRRTALKSTCTFLLTSQICQTSHATMFLKQVLLKKRDPFGKAGLDHIVRALNGEVGSGLVGVY